MHCHSRSATGPARTAANPRRADPATRVGDAEREEVSALLGDAAAGGYLPLHELDGRLERVWAASTSAELWATCIDLPAHLRQARALRRRADQGRHVLSAGLLPHLTSYVTVMALLVAIWVAVGLSGGGWYPWPVWPALGWGIGLVSHVAAARPAGRSDLG